MPAALDAEYGDARAEQELEWCPGTSATERQMAGFSDDCLGGHAPLHELRKRLDTSLVPLVARVEHGDERPGVE